MVRKIGLTCIVLAFCVLGCLESRSGVKPSDARRLDTSVGMIDYLRGQRLPALESVDTWQNKYGPGLKLTTKHYEIFTTLLEPLMLVQIPGFMESAYRGYNSQLPGPIETTSRFTVYLFARRDQWEDFTKTFAGQQSPLYSRIKAGAYYLNGACVAYNIGRERTFSVLGHEGWHQFNSRHFRFRLPSWLDEGIAMLFEVSRYDQGLFDFDPSLNLHRLGALKKTMMTNNMIPLRELVTINPGEVIVTSDEAVGAFYSQSYALVRFLREDDYGKRLGNYHRMLLDGLNGNWQLSELNRTIAADRNIPLTVWWNRAVGLQIFEQYIGDDFEQIKQEYTAFCGKIVYHVQLR